MQDATRVNRCLAILVRMTRFELLVELCPVLLSIARLIRRFRRGDVSPTTTFQFETELQGLLRELGRRIVQWTVNGLEPDERCEMPRQFLWNGDYYRRRNKSPLRNLNCLFGPISLLRYCYQPLEACGKCLFPLEIQLGIVTGVATPALADWVARGAADLTQRQLLDRLHSRKVGWGVRTLRKVTQAMAETLSVHRQEAQVQQVLLWLKKAAKSTGPHRFTLSVGRDGVMIPIVKQSKYKEACTATLSVLDRAGRRIGTVYLGQMPEAHQTTLSAELTALIREVLARWDGLLPRLVYVTDCGHHPTVYFEDVLCKMSNPRRPRELLKWEWVVDYYHACQYITRLAETIFGPGRAAFAWSAKQRRVLKEKSGGIFRVLRSAGALYTIRGLIGSEEVYWTAYRYLRQRASKMDYPTYRRFRLPIGSGVTEAACKIVFTQRFKQSGMKWKLDGGSDILRLRIIALSGVWSQVRDAALHSSIMPKVVTPANYKSEVDKTRRKIAA
jgi:hypothetical protein